MQCSTAISTHNSVASSPHPSHSGVLPLPAHASEHPAHGPATACMYCCWPEHPVTELPWHQCRTERGDNLLCTQSALLVKVSHAAQLQSGEADPPLEGKLQGHRLEGQPTCFAPHPGGYVFMTTSLILGPKSSSPPNARADFGTTERKFAG